MILCIWISLIFGIATSEITTFSDTLSAFGFADSISFYDRTEFYGFWHSYEDYGSDDVYLLDSTCPSGCSCNNPVLDCSGLSPSSTTVSFRKQNFAYINASSFPENEYTSVSEFSIISCNSFIAIESYVLDKFPNIQKLTITDTILGHLPAFQKSFTSLTNIDFYMNDLKSIREKYLKKVPNLEYLNLAGNQISFVSDKAFVGTSLRYISLAENLLPFVPNAFQAISETVQYIGLESNDISVVREMALSDLDQLQHLNISNNPITQIEYGVFSNCPTLQFIEMHGSALVELQDFSFYNIPSLKYISLYRSPSLVSLAGNTFCNLTQLSVILLQYGSINKMDYRMFNSTHNLEYLIFDNNALTAFPHVMLLEAQLSELKWLSLINNEISDLSEIADDYFLASTQILTTQYKSLFQLNVSMETMPNLYHLDLSGNNLIDLPDYLFTALPSLSHLYLDNNNIDDDLIGQNALTEHNTALRYVKLSSNNLKAVPSALFRPPNVYWIGLNQNLLTYLESQTFLNLGNLAYLYIGYNNILTIEDGTFPTSLQYLSLDNNDFNFLDENQFSNLPLLYYIGLSYNRITYLPDDVFANNTALLTVILNDNKLGWISNTVFKDTPLTGQINLDNNEIKTIEHGTFAEKNFQKFSAINNQLAYLPEDCMFCDLTNTQVQIYLQNNLIEYLSSYMFSNISSAYAINLATNLITSIRSNAFYNIHLLYTLSLTGNPINTIDSFGFNNFASLTAQSTLDVSGISPYNVIQPFTFNDVDIYYLYLGSNNISRIEKEAFNDVNIQSTLTLSNVYLEFIAKHAVVGYAKDIYLQNNNLARLTQGAFQMMQCSTIDLSNNEISFVDKKSLPDCTKEINLENNKIPRLIKNMIVDGSSLQILSLKNNNIQMIESDSLTDLKGSLQSLDLSDNKLPAFPSGVISGFTVLQSLLLSGNSIRTLEDQSDLNSLRTFSFDSNNNKLQYYSSGLLDDIASRNSTSLTVYNTDDNPLGCSCSNFEAFTNMLQIDRLQFASKDYCDFDGMTFSFSESSSAYFLSPGRVVLCEPVVTNFTRVTTVWVDDIADEEELTISWKLSDTALWNTNETFCCTENESTSCVNADTFSVICYNDDTDGVIVDEDVGVTQLEKCDYEFSETFSISYNSSSVACSVSVTATVNYIVTPVDNTTSSVDNNTSADGDTSAGNNSSTDTVTSYAGTKSSPNSPYMVAFPENKASVAINCENRDFPLRTTYFDFDNNMYDFQNFGDDDIISGLVFENHLLGPFLYKTANNDSVSNWFTVNENTISVLQEDLCLNKVSGSKRFRWFARNWYPLDGTVSTDSLDRDIDYIAHNLYFTARSSFNFRKTDSTEEIYAGGPDDVWIYIDGILVLELLAESDDNAELPCARLKITTTEIKIFYGTLDYAQSVSAKQRCDSTGETAELAINLEVDSDYPVDMFFTHRRSLSSSLFLEFKSIYYEEVLAPRFRYNVSENKPPEGLIVELVLENEQGVTGPYITEIVAGLGYGLIERNDYSFLSDIPENSTNAEPEGGIPSYYNCSSGQYQYETLPETLTNTIEENSASLCLMLAQKLDFDALDETSRNILFTFEIGFDNFNIEYVFKTAVLFQVTDANDNCPIFNDYSFPTPLVYESEYSLSMEGLQLNVTDMDSGTNQLLEYYIGNIERPYNESFYLDLDDYFLYESVFVDYIITVHAIDSAVNRYGASAEVLVTISTGCIRDINFAINKTSGLLHVEAPGWMVSAYNGSYCESCTIGYRCPGNGVRIKCTSCYQEYLDISYTWPANFSHEEEGCDSPSTAEFSFGGSSSCEPCKAGWICQEGLATPVLESMKYVEACTNDSCDNTIYDCEPGYSCVGGVAVTCNAGTYNDGSYTRCALCPPGKYTNNTGAGSCSCCPDGMESSHGKDQCKYCPWNELSSECGMCGRCQNSAECPCIGTEHGCYDHQPCINLPGESNLCLDCPDGFEAVNNSCSDVDECERYDPCFEGVHCTNLAPGFQCGPCPLGYSGTSPEGIGETDPQVCADVDECEVDNGGCDVNSECINLVGSTECGLCAAGMIGTGETLCTSGDLCSLSSHMCDDNADCIYTGPGSYVCMCGAQYAGNGYYCSNDTDLDGIPDSNLNCNETACFKDNCPDLANTDQADMDGDELGDECDDDVDGDMIVNLYDDCPYVADTNETADADGDGFPDVCDNCAAVSNPHQEDSDGDGSGDLCTCQGSECYTDDVCSGSGDGDGDGIADTCDNCLYVPNAQQTDTDADGQGDSCDDDTDDDGVPDVSDNCVYILNPDQADQDGDEVGDACDDSLSWPDVVNDKDSDNDGVIDISDTCPNNPNISTAHFKYHSVVDLTTSQEAGVWYVRDAGATVEQRASGVGPAVFLSKDRFDDMDFNGTFYVSSESKESGYMGLVYSYQSPGHMYLVVWRQDYKTWLHGNCTTDCHYSNAYGGTTGLQIRRVDISTTDKDYIESKLWLSSDSDVSTLLWQDPDQISWDPATPYRWFLSHRPSAGWSRIRIYTSGDGLIIDSGKVYDVKYLGGNVGLYNFRQSLSEWSNTVYACVPGERYGLSLSESYLTLGTLAQLNLTKNFMLSVWVMRNSEGADEQPILCTESGEVCLYLNTDLQLTGRVGDVSLSNKEPLESGTWYLVALKVDYQNHILTFYRNSDEISASLAPSFVADFSSILYLGTDLTDYFSGTVTDVRVITRLLESDAFSAITAPSLARQRSMGIVALHLTFEDKIFGDEFSEVQVLESSPSPEFVKVSLSGYLHQLREGSSLQRKKRAASVRTAGQERERRRKERERRRKERERRGAVHEEL